MPLLKGRFLFPIKTKADVIDSEDPLFIPHTNELFKSKEEYDKRLALYNQSIWTCQCTGAIKLTHKEACESETKVHDLLEEQFEKCYEKPVLKLVHHSTAILDNLTDTAWRNIHQDFCVEEPVQLKIKSDGEAIDASVVKVDEDETTTYSNGSSPSSNKENKDEENKPKAAETDSPKKHGTPKLLPHKYTIKLSSGDVEKVISGVPAEDLVRLNRPPNKELIKLFIRAKAVRGGYTFNSPWVVDDLYVNKYSLPSKYADFLVSPAKMAELGRKALEEAAKCTKEAANKRKSSLGVSPAKRAKMDKDDKKQTTLKVVRGRGRPKGSTNKDKDASPKKSPTKAVSILQVASASDSSSSESSDEESSSEDSSEEEGENKNDTTKGSETEKEKPAKKEKKKKEVANSDKRRKRAKPLNDGEKKRRGRPRIHPPKMKVLLADGSPRKRGRPKKSDSPVKTATPGKTTTPVKTPAKPKTPKKLKQMTLFDMKGKKKKDATPKKDSPKKKKDGSKSPKKPASPYRLPPLASRLKKALDKGQKTTANLLTGQCARDLSLAQIKKLPVDLKSKVMEKYEVIQEKKRVEKMTPEQKEEYMKKKKEEMKKKLREKMKQRWIQQNKRFEDSDLDHKQLPVPKLASTPDGMPNELFGDVALVTEFIGCYSGLLMPEDQTPIYTNELMKSLAAGQAGYGYLSKVLAILLQTLLQDEIAEDYKELSTSLSDIAVNQYTVSELVRLCLRTRDTDSSSSTDSEQQEDEQEEDELPEGLIEQLESNELFELPAEAKLQILTGLCHRIMGSYSVQDYMETKQQEASELWRKRIASQKEKNDLLKEEKQKKKSAKKNGGKEETPKVKEPEKTEKDGLTIKNFYGQQVEASPVDEGDLASVVKSRRLMAAKAAEDKRTKDKEERSRREKEMEEQRRLKDFDTLEKQFLEGTSLARVVLRQTPLGTDRHHDRYWLFHSCTPGLYVEKGWANKDVDYSVGDGTCLSESSSSEDSSADEEGEPLKRGRKKKTEHRNRETTAPHTGQNLWFVIDTAEQVEKLAENLNPMGIRESNLKKELTQSMEQISKMFKEGEKKEDDTPIPGAPPLEACKAELIDLEARLKNGGLGGVPNFTLWEKEVMDANLVSQLGDLLIESQKHVLDKFFKGMMAVKVRKEKGKEETMDTEGVKDEVKSEREEEDGDEKPFEFDLYEGSEEVYPGIESWAEAVQACPTWSRLHVLMGILDSCIKWERSAENAKCKICRKKGDEDRLLLCDECNQPFHLYCLRPSLLEVPAEEWFCPACVPQSKRRSSRKTNYRQLADYSDSEGSSSEEEQDDVVNEENCVVCGGDEGIYGCSTCSSSFHLDCHEPPLRTAPRASTWRCMQCKTGVRIMKRSSRTESRKRRRYVESDSDSDYEERPKKKARTAKHAARSAPETTRSGRTCNATSSAGRRSREAAEVYDESDLWATRQAAGTSTRPKTVNGMKEEEWEEEEEEGEEENSKNMLQITRKMKNHGSGWPFKHAVDKDQVPDYYNIVKKAIDLGTIENKCISEQYLEVEEFTDDVALMFDNAELYNTGDSVVGKCVPKLEKFFMDQLCKLLPDSYYRRAPQEDSDKSDSNGTTLVNSDHAYC